MSQGLALCFYVAACISTVLTLATAEGSAQIDAGGKWSVRISIDELQYADSIETWTQNGSTLQVGSGPCAYAGTIDTQTGDFVVEIPNTLPCRTLQCQMAGDDRRSGRVSPDGRALTGDVQQCYPGIGAGGCTCTVFSLDGKRCGNGVIEAGEQCDDANRDDTDGCRASCNVGPCSTCSGEPSVCTPLADGLDCDDENGCTFGDTCSAGACVGTPKVCDETRVCQVFDNYCEPSSGECTYRDRLAGFPCNDSDPCTSPDRCDGSGHCIGQPATCDDGHACTEDACDPGVGCVHRAPQTVCSTAAHSLLSLKNDTDDRRDGLTYVWKGPRSTPPGTDLGDGHLFCVYSGTASALVSEVSIPGQSDAARDTSRLRMHGTGGGSTKVRVRGRTIRVRGQGESLPDVTPPFTLPVTARLTSESTQACWSSSFDQADVKKNEPGKFRARN